MGIDFSQYDLDEPIGAVKSNAIVSAVANFQAATNDGREWTIRDIAEWGGIGGLGPRIVGSGSEVADQLQEWVSETDVDGFNLAYAITPGSFQDVISYVVPELQKRGAYPTEYTHGTLRNKLHNNGDRLPDTHKAASFRVPSSQSQENLT
jgi:alkanesulfonate monooxygenase SsuD/methylene tetrahydromethanopterin reductase-like flavin-dependent oxidoreductase (luciferase family)